METTYELSLIDPVARQEVVEYACDSLPAIIRALDKIGANKITVRIEASIPNTLAMEEEENDHAV